MKPTLEPHDHFDAHDDAEKLRKAMKGLGTDEKEIIKIMGKRTNIQRQRIAHAFKQEYGKDLKKELESETKGHFESLLKALATPMTEFLASQLHKAIHRGIGTDEDCLIDILCTRTNEEINQIKEKYQHEYNRSLEHDIKKDTSRFFEELMVTVVKAERHEDDHGLDEAKELAEQLYKAGQGQEGTDEDRFIRILTTYSYHVTRKIFDEYKEIKGDSLYKAIKEEFMGDMQKGLLAVVHSIENKSEWYAQLIHDSFKGIGTDDSRLIRVIVTRCEIDLETIKHDYSNMFKHSMKHDLKNETHGYYQDLLLKLMDE